MQPNSASSAYALKPAGFASSLPERLLLGLVSTLVVALAAHVSFPLPFTVVPLTLQPLAVLGVGLIFGRTVGFLTMLAYLAEGAAGLPVFSPQGPGGVAQIVGFTGGYLMSYPLVAAIAGDLTRALRTRVPAFVAALTGCSAAVVVLYLCGAGWLMARAHLTPLAAWTEGVLPFLPGEIVKVLAAAGTYSAFVRPRRA